MGLQGPEHGTLETASKHHIQGCQTPRSTVLDAHLLILLVLCVHQVTHNGDVCKHPLGNLLTNIEKEAFRFPDLFTY